MTKKDKKTSSTRKSYTFKRVSENLYKVTETGGYYALVKRGGKQIRRSLKTTDKALAKRRLAELKQKASKLRTGKEHASITFEKYSERWIMAKEASLKSQTIRRMKDCLKGIKPYLGDSLIRNITYQDCERWLIGRGKVLKPSAYRQERQLMIGVLKAAERDGIILDNPAIQLPNKKLPKIVIQVPTHDQFRSLIKQMRQADSRGIHGAYLVELLAYSGMRLNEATNLLWSEIDLDRDCFTVTGGEYGTKNHDIRTVPLFPAMRELLERIRSAQTETNSDYVTPIKGARTLMANAAKKAGIPKFTHHSMRHYFCSNAIEVGIDFKVIAGWLGHKDGGILVAKTYGHLRDTHSFEMAKRMTQGADEVEPKNVVNISDKTA
jgi:integrase